MQIQQYLCELDDTAVVYNKLHILYFIKLNTIKYKTI